MPALTAHSRAIHAAKWSLLTAAVAFFVLWMLLIPFGAWYIGDEKLTLYFRNGLVSVNVINWYPRPGWRFFRSGSSDPWPRRLGLSWPSFSRDNHGLRCAIVPLWLPFAATAVPAGYFWHRDRRRIPPGHCRKCGYDQTGNVSGICPECGLKIGAASRPVAG